MMKRHLLCGLAASLFITAGTARAITLNDAIALGKQRSLQMQEPRIERTRVNGRIAEAWSNALPQIEGTAGYLRWWKRPVLFFPSFTNPDSIMKIETQYRNSGQYEATLTQPLYTFGRVSAGLRAAYSARRSNDHLTRFTDRSVELEVMQRFWTVLLLRDVVEARRGGLAISDSALAKIQRLRDVGMMSDYDVLRAQVQANNQIPPLRQAENNLHLAELSLRDLLGVPLDTNLTADGRLDQFEATADTSAGDLAHRDDLEALRDLTDVFRNTYVIYRNSFWPVLGGQLKYSWQWSNNEWTINEMNSAKSFYGGLSLTVPIFTGGKQWGQTQQAKADWQRSKLDLERAERGAQMQYEAATRSYQTATASEDAARVTVEQAGTARRLAQTKLEQGQITPLEMDAAQLDELVAKVALAQARYDRLVAAAEVRMALGLPPHSN
jgi:outer membrane protein TolC